MPNAGAVEYAYNRQYKYIKPSNTDPGTYRLATPPDAASGGGSGGGGGTANIDIDGVLPVEVETTAGATVTIHTISLDFQKLSGR